MHVTRLYTGDDGHSHFEDVPIDMVDYEMRGQLSDPWSASAVQFREVGGDYALDDQLAPRGAVVVE
ncbi:MAG: hypothetical protein AAFO29_17365, partial [Actinomycetota bacterium]